MSADEVCIVLPDNAIRESLDLGALEESNFA